MKNSDYLTLCSSILVNRRFRRTNFLDFETLLCSTKLCMLLVSCWLFCILLDPGDGISTFLRNVGSFLPDCIALHLSCILFIVPCSASRISRCSFMHIFIFVCWPQRQMTYLVRLCRNENLSSHLPLV